MDDVEAVAMADVFNGNNLRSWTALIFVIDGKEHQVGDKHLDWCRAAYAAGVARERERCANPSPFSVVDHRPLHYAGRSPKIKRDE
jgi:hypothetical protein